MGQRPPSNVCWVFAAEDAPAARELLSRAVILEAPGLIQNWILQGTPPDFTMAREDVGSTSLLDADAVVLLCSHALLAGPVWQSVLLQVPANPAIRIIPVLLNVTSLPAELAAYHSLPRSGVPLLGSLDREGSLFEVIKGLLEIIEFRPPVLRRSAPVMSGTNINHIFVTKGEPAATFVEPPELDRLLLELRTLGSGLLVEGPAKVGKSTAVRKAMAMLGEGPEHQIWWNGEKLLPFAEFDAQLDQVLRATHKTWLFIDDFHRVEDERYLRALSATMKILSDQPARHAKITLLGINPLGSPLVQATPDLSGRFRIIQLDVHDDALGNRKVLELILQGEAAANVKFRQRGAFVAAAGGNFYLAQYLCLKAVIQANVEESQPELVTISLGPGDVVFAMQHELGRRFRNALIDFASWSDGFPPKGATLSLLWLLSRSDNGVFIRDLRQRFPWLNSEIKWLVAGNLSRCLHEKPRLRGVLYYKDATQQLVLDDHPELRYYLRQLDWTQLAIDSGHGAIKFHPHDGPLWPIVVAANAASGEVVTRRSHRRVLHLSDLHISTKDQVIGAYSKLAADLREQGVDEIDMLIVSGDLVTRGAPAEYEAVRLFLESMMTGFSLSAAQVVLVPGNHDVSWRASEDAYRLEKRERVRTLLVAGTYIAHGDDIVEVRDDDAYRRRFEPFAALYRAIKGVDYHLAYEEQATIDELPDLGICVLGLNSAWDLDHHFTDRASVPAQAVATALAKLGPGHPSELRIAVFHHPVTRGDDAVLQRLAAAGFHLVLHGHVHDDRVHYDRRVAGHAIEVVVAGTFGAPTRAPVPFTYNLLQVGDREITVERRRREADGAWQPDPLPRYTIPR